MQIPKNIQTFIGNYRLTINLVCSLTALYLYCLVVGIQWSSLPHGHFLMTTILRGLQIAVVGFLFCALITSKPRFAVIHLIAGAVFVMSLIITKDYRLLFFFLVACALKEVPLDKIGITIALGAITEILVLYILCRLGIARDMISGGGWFDVLRHSYGFSNTNRLGIVASVFVVGVFCFWFNRLSAIKIAILAGLAISVFVFTRSRASFLLVIVAFIVAGGGKLFPALTRKLTNLFIYLLPVAALIIVFFVLLLPLNIFVIALLQRDYLLSIFLDGIWKPLGYPRMTYQQRFSLVLFVSHIQQQPQPR